MALVYANCRITAQENAHFATAPVSGHFRWFPYDHINLWRRNIHDTMGFFNEKYQVTGDYDMWLRVSERFPLLHIPEELGLYLRYDNNLETQNPEKTQQEYIQVQTEALRRFLQSDFTPHIPFEQQWTQHKQRLERYICNLENGNSIKNPHKLAYHIYAYLLLQAKLHMHTIS